MTVAAGSSLQGRQGRFSRRAVPGHAGWLTDNIRELGRQFRAGRQEDTHEFPRRLLEHCGRSALAGAGVREGEPSHWDETTPAHAIFDGYFQNQCVRRGTVCVARACLRALPAACCTLCRPAAPLCVRVVCTCARRQAAGSAECTWATTSPRPALPTASGTWPMTNMGEDLS